MDYDFDSNPFWDFSVEFYRRPGVAQACLRLQTSLGVDVNLLLFGVWQAKDGRNRLTSETFRKLIEATADWHENVVRTMRRARQAAKAGHPFLSPPEAEAAYRGILGTELALERYEQLIIARLGERLKAEAVTTTSNVTARTNMHAYLQALSKSPDSDDMTALDAIADATIGSSTI